MFKEDTPHNDDASFGCSESSGQRAQRDANENSSLRQMLKGALNWSLLVIYRYAIVVYIKRIILIEYRHQ